MKEKKRVLLICVAGIGNVIMQTPFINSVLNRNDLVVDVLFGNAGGGAVFKHDKRINKRYFKGNLIEDLGLILELRKNKYDYCVSTFPSNRFEYNLLGFLVGAKNRVIHSYNAGKVLSLSFLSNVKVDVDEELHDVYQNLNLLKVFEIGIPKKAKVSFDVSDENERYAKKFLNRLDRSKKTIGIHVGCGPLKEKMWPVDNFLRLSEMLKEEYNVIVFGFGSELKPFEMKKGIFICESNLNNVAAVISKCDKFLSVDSGLMHVASVFGVRQYVLWGPTSYSRTRPFSENVVVMGRTDVDCLRYPFRSVFSGFSCRDANKYMRDITALEVYEKIGDE